MLAAVLLIVLVIVILIGVSFLCTCFHIKRVRTYFSGREEIPLSEQLATLDGKVDIAAAEKLWREIAENLKDSLRNWKTSHIPVEALRLDDSFERICGHAMVENFEEKAYEEKRDIDFSEIHTLADVLRAFCGK